MRGASTLPTRAMPVTAVLQRSKLVRRAPFGATICLSRASKEYALDWRSRLSGVSLPGEPRLVTKGWGRRKDSVFHARG